MAKLKICHFLNYVPEFAGGTTGMVMSLMEHSKHHHTYVTFNMHESKKLEFKARGLDYYEIGSDNIPEAIDYMKRNADVVHAQNSGGPEPGVSIGIESGLPTVETCQSPSLPSGHLYDQVTVVVVSEGVLQHWPDDLAHSSRVIYSCADPVTLMDKFKCKSNVGLDGNRKVIGRIGRLEGIKRPSDFLYAVEQLHAMRPEYQFLIAGDGSDGLGIRDHIRKLKLRGIDIIYTGFVTGEQKNVVYNAMDLFLYPTSFEGFGIVFAEAMSAKLPIVTYSDPVNVDVVKDAGVFAVDNVFTTSIADPYYGLVKLTVDLLENEREFNKLSARSYTRYNRYFRPERMAEEYDKLYKEITK